MQTSQLLLALSFFFLTASPACLADDQAVPATAIASGSPQWVASKGDQTSTDAMVDIGTMRQVGDELEVEIRWPYVPESFGPEPAELDRIICLEDHAISFAIEDGFISEKGRRQVTKTYNHETRRQEAEEWDAQMSKFGGGFSSYGSDPRSLACWAAAHRCADQAFTWPAPPNETPLENTPEALKMNAEYNLAFVPTCTLE